MRKLLVLIIALLALTISLSSADAGGKATFSRLEITDIKLSGHKIHIRGDSDLPQGSKLHLDFKVPWLTESQGNKKTIKARVNSNHFFVMIDVPKDIKLKNLRGLPMLFNVFFRPSLQVKDIKLKVGDKGEQLTGEHIIIKNGERFLSNFYKFVL